jgi:hypothetical protein
MKKHTIAYDALGKLEVIRLRKMTPLKKFTHIHPATGRFCERCKKTKPANELKHVKGWACTDCIIKRERTI